jgi:prevent-host-death family protein
MSWNVAQAKQKLSELLRNAAGEPQLICNRGRPVAVVLNPQLFDEFQCWRDQRERSSLAEAFAELRKLCIEEAYTLEPGKREDRSNAFADTTVEVPV